MLNQNAVSVNPAPVHSLKLAGTPERVDFIFTRALRRLGRLYDVAYNSTPREIIDALKIDRVEFKQNESDPDAAIVIDAINLTVDALVEYIDDDDASRKERKNIVGRLIDNILTIKGARDRRAETTTAEPETTEPETTEPETTEPETTELKTTEPETTEPETVKYIDIAEEDAFKLRQFEKDFLALTRARKDVEQRYRRIVVQYLAYKKDQGIVIIGNDGAVLLDNITGVVVTNGNTPQQAARQYARVAAEYIDSLLYNKRGGAYKKEFPAVASSDSQTSQPDAAILAVSSAFASVGTYAAPLMIGQETQQNAPAETIDDDVLTEDEKRLLSSIDWEKGDTIPALLLRSINEKSPIWVKPWFNYASLQRKYFDGARYSIGNMLRLMLQGANPDFYVSRTEARRILGKDAAPKEGARAYKVIKPRIWGAKNLTKNDLDALRRREYVPVEMKNDEEMNDLERKHAGKIRFETESIYHQGAFEGLPLKHTEPLYRNDNERNALADKVLTDFCAANNITLCIMPGVNRACCSFVIDDDAPITITAPTIEDHKSAADYYSTLFHEALHAANRRNHCQLTKKREELSAEIGSCIVLNTLGFDSAEYIDNSAAYVKGWKDVANEKNAIVKAWKYAEKSANLILASFFEMQRNAIKTDGTEPETTEPETEPTTTEPETQEPAELIETVEPVETENTIDDDETIRDLAEWVKQYESDAEQAYYTNGIVHADTARRSERDARAAIQEAREAGTISDARADEIEAQIDAIKRQWAPESAPTSLF